MHGTETKLLACEYRRTLQIPKTGPFFNSKAQVGIGNETLIIELQIASERNLFDHESSD